MRSIRSRKNLSAICSRFCEFVERDLNLSYSELARKLGYANASIFTRVKRGEGFLDIERLDTLVAIGREMGIVVDLQWILTGKHSSSVHLYPKKLSKWPKLAKFVDRLDEETLDRLEQTL